MPVCLIDAHLLQLDPATVTRGGLRIDDGYIVAAGSNVAPQPGDTTYDCKGAVVVPGLVNGHTHLYSALAPGMPPPPRDPRNFHEILELIWWRLDRALDAESIEMSGRVGALDALRCGTTTLIDHHASPNCIAGSLDALERGIADAGPRAVLCYETTDRHGAAGAAAGLDENRRYHAKCRQRTDGRFGALVGAHAAFTLSDASLRQCVELAAGMNSGVHIHVAEDPCDDAICRERYGAPLVQRLKDAGVFEADVAGRSIMAHATHLSPDDAAALSPHMAGVAHNARSNMNNRVGYAPIGVLNNVQLGTDGIGADMFTEARHAWFKARDAERTNGDPKPHSQVQNPITPARIVDMLAHSALVAGRILDCRLGVLEAGAVADVVVTDYVPATPLDSENAAGHLIFAMGAQHVRDVYVGGDRVLADRQPTRKKARSAPAEAVSVARALWDRMQSLKE